VDYDATGLAMDKQKDSKRASFSISPIKFKVLMWYQQRELL